MLGLDRGALCKTGLGLWYLKIVQLWGTSDCDLLVVLSQLQNVNYLWKYLAVWDYSAPGSQTHTFKVLFKLCFPEQFSVRDTLHFILALCQRNRSCYMRLKRSRLLMKYQYGDDSYVPLCRCIVQEAFKVSYSRYLCWMYKDWEKNLKWKFKFYRKLKINIHQNINIFPRQHLINCSL